MAKGFRSASSGGGLSEDKNVYQQGYLGVEVPDYVAPPPPPPDNPDDGGDDNNDSANASTQMSLDQANQNINAAMNDQYADFGVPTMHGPSPMGMIPGSGLFGPAVPTSGYGTPGTYSSLTGNQFDQDSRGIDPITGYAMPEYGTQKAFANQMMQDPLGNILGDPKNAFDYDPNSKKSQTVQFSEAKGLDTDKAATKALLDMGVSVSQAQPGTATHDAQLGIGYSDTGAATSGSQYSSTGVFSSEPNTGGPDASDPNSGGNQSGGVGQSNSAANQGYADDAAASDSGGGGGCVVATHGVSTGAFTILEKAKAELWCQKKYHDKWYGEAFRRGYKAVGMRHVNNGTAPSVYQEFKDFVAYGRGIKRDWKSAINYYYRTITFFVIGLFIGDK